MSRLLTIFCKYFWFEVTFFDIIGFLFWGIWYYFAYVKHWLIKSEPFKYSWEQFEKDKKTFWDGVRNYQARNNLREMNPGDWCLYYHSNEGKERQIIGFRAA